MVSYLLEDVFREIEVILSTDQVVDTVKDAFRFKASKALLARGGRWFLEVLDEAKNVLGVVRRGVRGRSSLDEVWRVSEVAMGLV